MSNGKWKLSSISPALVINSGLVYTLGKRPQGLTLEEVLAMIKEHPRQSYYKKVMKRRVTLAEAKTLGLDKLGQEIEMFSGFNLLTQQYDREFKSLPKTGQQLLKRIYSSTAKGV